MDYLNIITVSSKQKHRPKMVRKSDWRVQVHFWSQNEGTRKMDGLQPRFHVLIKGKAVSVLWTTMEAPGFFQLYWGLNSGTHLC
jgi:hypothetical protein